MDKKNTTQKNTKTGIYIEGNFTHLPSFILSGTLFHPTVGQKDCIFSVCNSDSSPLLTRLDMWSEHSAGGCLALWPCSPEACPLVHVGRCAWVEQTSLQCDSLLPPPPTYKHALTHRHTDAHTLLQVHTSLLPCFLEEWSLLSCCSPSSYLHPHNLSQSLGTIINGLRFLRPRQWLTPSAIYLLHPLAWKMGPWSCWGRWGAMDSPCLSL